MADTGKRVDDALLAKLEHALLSVDRLTVKKILDECNAAVSALQFVEQLIVPVMERIGKGWENGSVALSQVYMSGRICEDLLNDILPPGSQIREPHPKMAIAVLDDHHLLGKRIVHSVLRAGGFALLDYGTMEAESLVDRVKDNDIRILLISTLMLHSALHIKDVRRRLDEAGCNVEIVVGGAPFRLDKRLWKDVKADAVGYNAGDALSIVTRIVKEIRAGEL